MKHTFEQCWKVATSCQEKNLRSTESKLEIARYVDENY